MSGAREGGAAAARGWDRGLAAPVAVLCLLVSACIEPSAPRPDTVLDDLSFSFPVGTDPDKLAQRFLFYAGTSAADFSLSIELVNGSAEAPLTATSGGGTGLVSITEDGVHTVDFPGNVGWLEVSSAGLVSPPALWIRGMTIRHRSGPSIPEVAGALADSVASLPLSIGQPLEMILPEGGRYVFASVSDVAGKRLDVVLDGPGDQDASLYVNTDATGEFALSAQGAEEVAPAGGPGRLELDVPSSSSRLFLTVHKPEGTPRGLGRLTVLDVGAQVTRAATVSLVTPEPLTAEQAAEVREIANGSAVEVYRVTRGLVRIAAIAVTRRSPLQAGPPFGDDIYVLAAPVPGLDPSGVGGPVLVTLSDLESLGPSTLARALLQAKMGLQSEVTLGENLCPNSLMSGGATFHLCWSGNHNPTQAAELPSSAAWTTLSLALGVALPTAKPPYILRNRSTVRLPVSVTIQ